MARNIGFVFRLIRRIPGLQLGVPLWAKVSAIVAYLTVCLLLACGFLLIDNKLWLVIIVPVCVSLLFGLFRYLRRAMKAHSINNYVDLLERRLIIEHIKDEYGTDEEKERGGVTPQMIRRFLGESLSKVSNDNMQHQEFLQMRARLNLVRRKYLDKLAPEVADLYWKLREGFLIAIESRIGPPPEIESKDNSVPLIKDFLEKSHPFGDSIIYEAWSEIRCEELNEQFYWATDLGYTAKSGRGWRQEYQQTYYTQHGAIKEARKKQNVLQAERLTL